MLNNVPCRVSAEGADYHRELARVLEEQELTELARINNHMSYMRFCKRIKQAAKQKANHATT